MNYRVFRAVNDLAGDTAVDAIMRFAARDLIFALYAFLIIASGVRLAQRRPRPVIYAAVAFGLAVALGRLAAVLHPERRPFQTHQVHLLIGHAAGQSFPSDHATRACAVALIVWAFFSRRWGAALCAAALLIGFARVFVGVHYPGDVIGGLLVSAVAVSVVVGCRRVLEKRTPEGA